MSIYGKDIDYEKRMKSNIELAKLLYNIPEENRKEVTKLFNEKLEILDKNPLLANLKIKRINKKIDKLKNSKHIESNGQVINDKNISNDEKKSDEN